MPTRKIKILLIEDDLPTIDIYEEILRKSNFIVETINWAKGAFQALEEMRKGKREKPDLVLLDLILPDINGIEILRKAKETDGLKDIPFFILTNYTDPQLENESKTLNAEKYIIKSNLVPSQLIKIIKEWFKKNKGKSIKQIT
jgi:CheY-like chemotaxis protein